MLGLAALALLAGGAYLLTDRGPDVPIVPQQEETAAAPVRLVAAAAYDPFGNDGEHDSEIAEATDRNPATDWRTESYQAFTKDGVGLVLSAPRDVALTTLTVRAEPGFTATIRAGNNPNGPFQDVSDEKEIAEDTTAFEIDTAGKRYRYYVVWLRLPREGGQAQIFEVTAKT